MLENQKVVLACMGLAGMLVIVFWGTSLILKREGYSNALKVIVAVVFCVCVAPPVGRITSILIFYLRDRL